MKKICYPSEDLHDHQGIGAVIKDAQNRILMQEHIKFSMWTIPVGKVKPGQTVEQALHEELFEECGISIKGFRELDYHLFEYNRNGIPVKVFHHLFEILSYSGTVTNKEPHKHSQQIFLSIPEILMLHALSDSTLLYLKRLGIKRQKTL